MSSKAASASRNGSHPGAHLGAHRGVQDPAPPRLHAKGLLSYTALVAAGAALLIGLAWLASTLVAALLAWPGVMAADRAIAESLHAHASPAAVEAMTWVSRLHGTTAILAMSALLAAWLVARGERSLLPRLVASVPGGLLLNAALKIALHRARPDTAYAAERLASFSFPSGHTAGATFLYGFIVLLLWQRARGSARAAAVAGAILMVFLVATSRVMLGMHYATDCAAAVAEGVAWLAICHLAARASPP
ncbi:MAG: phosphatase PAP2 family protein [Betaproteobacteria bacterium]